MTAEDVRAAVGTETAAYTGTGGSGTASPGRGARGGGPGVTRRSVPARLSGYGVLAACALFAVFPFAWMLLTSIRRNDTVFGKSVIPREVTFDAYRTAWTKLDIPGHFLTSLWITLVTVVIVVLLATLAGYGFAKLQFPGKRLVYGVLMSALMLPPTAVVVPLFLELKQLDLIDTRFGLLLVYVGTSLPFAMFLMRAFFRTLPDGLADAARIDGAGELRIFWQVMLPLTWPGIAALVIFQFMITWNEFLLANTLLQTPQSLPLQPVLYTLRGQYATDWPTLTAALTLSVVPIIVVYFRMQRRFVAGLTMGALKD